MSAPIAAARATAVVSEPPRPSVVTSCAVETPWKPATITTLPSARASLMRPARTSRMRALPCRVSVMMPACDPVNDLAVTPRSAIAIASRDMAMRSPAVSSMSISRGGGSGETRLASATRSSVLSPMAETTTTTSLPAWRVATTRSATRRIRGASATEVPPYFWTTRAMVFPCGQAGDGRVQPTKPSPARDPSGTQPLQRQLAAAGEGAAEGNLVGVLEVAADRQAARDAGDPDAERREQAGQVHRGRLPLDVGVGGQDHLADPVRLQAGQQLPDPQVVGTHPLDRADRPAEHVVAAAELLGPLDRDQVAGLLDHADQARVAPRVPADAAEVALGHVPADAAEVDPGLDLLDGPCQALGVGRLDLEQVEGDPLGALGPDPGQPAELVDQVLDGAFVHVTAPGRVAAPCPG